MKGNIRIKIQGELDVKWKEWFIGMELSYEGHNTIISGFIMDEAFLHGIFNKLRDLNLIIISVNPANTPNESIK